MKNRFKKGSALVFTIILLIFVSGLSLTISLLMYQTTKISSNEIDKKHGQLIATNYAYNTFYEFAFDLNNYNTSEYTTETVEDVTTVTKGEQTIAIKTYDSSTKTTTINYVLNDVVVTKVEDEVNNLIYVTSKFKNKFITKLTIDGNQVIKLEEGE